MAECVTLYRECLGVSTWEPPAWRSVLHCIASVFTLFGCIYLRASCMAECVTLYSECLSVSTWEPPAWRSVLHCIASVFTLCGCIYLRASCMAECVTLYRECLGVSTWEPPAWRSVLHCIASVWVYLPESLLHGGVCYTVSWVFRCIYLRASCMAECVTLYRECLGVSTWEPPAWRSVLHCIVSV